MKPVSKFSNPSCLRVDSWWHPPLWNRGRAPPCLPAVSELRFLGNLANAHFCLHIPPVAPRDVHVWVPQIALFVKVNMQIICSPDPGLQRNISKPRAMTSQRGEAASDPLRASRSQLPESGTPLAPVECDLILLFPVEMNMSRQPGKL